MECRCIEIVFVRILNMNSEKLVVGIRREVLGKKGNYLGWCGKVKRNSCMEMNVLNCDGNIFKFGRER